MEIASVLSEEFKAYGKIYALADTQELAAVLNTFPLPAEGTEYIPSCPELEALKIADYFKEHIFGDMPIQVGLCCGKNSALNCLEYHRDSELNFFTEDVVLMLGKVEDICGNSYDSGNVKLFYAPAGVVIELYATTLHYCPANVSPEGFRAACVLPKGTNTPLEKREILAPEDELLYMRNKWIIAHKDAPEANNGVKVGITNKNITYSADMTGRE